MYNQFFLILKQTPRNPKIFLLKKNQQKKLLLVVDHSARWSRKNVASYVNRCKMQDIRALDIRTHIAAQVWSGLCLSERRLNAKHHQKIRSRMIIAINLVELFAVWLARLPLGYWHYVSTSAIRSNPLKEQSVLSTSDQARLPAEFKHINKRRKRNQMGFP